MYWWNSDSRVSSLQNKPLRIQLNVEFIDAVIEWTRIVNYKYFYMYFILYITLCFPFEKVMITMNV